MIADCTRIYAVFLIWTDPPTVAKAKATVDLNMKRMLTDDRFHETWWHEMVRDYPARGPLDFRYVFQHKPPATGPSILRGNDVASAPSPCPYSETSTRKRSSSGVAAPL